MKKIRFGVIGAGGIAMRRTIPEGIMPAANAELIAVMDVDPERAKNVADKFCRGRFFTNEEELLKLKEIDAFCKILQVDLLDFS